MVGMEVGQEHVGLFPVRIQFRKACQQGVLTFGAVIAGGDDEGFPIVLNDIAVQVPEGVIGQGHIYLKNIGIFVNFFEHPYFLAFCFVLSLIIMNRVQ